LNYQLNLQNGIQTLTLSIPLDVGLCLGVLWLFYFSILFQFFLNSSPTVCSGLIQRHIPENGPDQADILT
jgi:hypothetical protein